MRTLPFSFIALMALALPTILTAVPIVIDFEGQPDSTALTNQYPGVSFSNGSRPGSRSGGGARICASGHARQPCHRRRP